VAGGGQGGRDRAQRRAAAAHLRHAPDRPLLLGHLNQLAGTTDAPAEGDDAAQVAPPRPLVGLHVCDALADAVALGLGHGGEDGEDQLRDAVARHVAAEIDHVQAHAAVLEAPQDVERVQRAAEHAVELRRHHGVAGPETAAGMPPPRGCAGHAGHPRPRGMAFRLSFGRMPLLYRSEAKCISESAQ
jgi:hypothetical protein